MPPQLSFHSNPRLRTITNLFYSEASTVNYHSQVARYVLLSIFSSSFAYATFLRKFRHNPVKTCPSSVLHQRFEELLRIYRVKLRHRFGTTPFLPTWIQTKDSSHPEDTIEQHSAKVNRPRHVLLPPDLLRIRYAPLPPVITPS